MTGDAGSGPLERFDLTSLVPRDDRYAVLRDLFPEAFSEMELVPEGLSAAIDHMVLDPRRERYGLSWPGKAAAAGTITGDTHEIAHETRVGFQRRPNRPVKLLPLAFTQRIAEELRLPTPLAAIPIPDEALDPTIGTALAHELRPGRRLRPRQLTAQLFNPPPENRSTP